MFHCCCCCGKVFGCGWSVVHVLELLCECDGKEGIDDRASAW